MIYLDENAGPAVARRIIEAIRKTMQLIFDNPDLGQTFVSCELKTKFLPAYPPARKYLVSFQRQEDAVVITQVFHGARQQSDALRDE